MTKGGTYASPPCMAGEVDPAYFDPLGVDPGQARDVVRWRRAERVRLAGLREGPFWVPMSSLSMSMLIRSPVRSSSASSIPS